MKPESRRQPAPGEPRHRMAAMDPSGMDADSRAVPLSVSSEEPILEWVFVNNRWEWAYQILSHAPGAVDLSRFSSERGGPMLFNHNWDLLIGRFFPSAIGADRMLRGVGKFATTSFADERFQEMKEGILVDVSITFDVDPDSITRVGTAEDGLAIYRAERWTLFEVSPVSIPADITVGVGRGLSAPAPAGEPTPEPTPSRTDSGNPAASATPAPVAATTKEIRMSGEPTPVAPVATDPQNIQSLLTAERKETMELRKMAETVGVIKEVDDLLASGKSLQEVRSEAVRLIGSRAVALPAPPAAERLDLTEKERERYSIGKAVRAMVTGKWDDAGFERECSRELEKKTGIGTRGILVPSDFRIHRLAQRMLGQRGANTMNTGTTGQGKELVFTEYGGFIDFLYNQAKVLSMGATMLPGLTSNYSFVRQNAASTVYWLGENPGADVTDSKLGLELVSLTPKTLKAQLSYTRQQFIQSVEAIDGLIESDLVVVHGLEMDRVAIAGSGSANQPKGILSQTGVQLYNIGPDGNTGGTPTYKTTNRLKTLVNKANALGLGPAGYLSTPDIQDTLENTAKLANTISQAVWEGNKIGSWRAESTNQVPSNLTKGTASNLHAMIFGVWSQLMIGEFGALELVYDPYTLAGQDVVRILSSQLLDINLRQASAFAVTKDLVPTA